MYKYCLILICWAGCRTYNHFENIMLTWKATDMQNFIPVIVAIWWKTAIEEAYSCSAYTQVIEISHFWCKPFRKSAIFRWHPKGRCPNLSTAGDAACNSSCLFLLTIHSEGPAGLECQTQVQMLHTALLVLASLFILGIVIMYFTLQCPIWRNCRSTNVCTGTLVEYFHAPVHIERCSLQYPSV